MFSQGNNILFLNKLLGIYDAIIDDRANSKINTTKKLSVMKYNGGSFQSLMRR